MNIEILHLVDGAKAAKGLTVIIDVFRAFTVETYLARNHAERIIPVGDVQTAFDYKKAHPDTTILCGERGGAIIDGLGTPGFGASGVGVPDCSGPAAARAGPGRGAPGFGAGRLCSLRFCSSVC